MANRRRACIGRSPDAMSSGTRDVQVATISLRTVDGFRVRDRLHDHGIGFEHRRTSGGGLSESVIGRMNRVGGVVDIWSSARARDRRPTRLAAGMSTGLFHSVRQTDQDHAAMGGVASDYLTNYSLGMVLVGRRRLLRELRLGGSAVTRPAVAANLLCLASIWRRWLRLPWAGFCAARSGGCVWPGAGSIAVLLTVTCCCSALKYLSEQKSGVAADWSVRGLRFRRRRRPFRAAACCAGGGAHDRQ